MLLNGGKANQYYSGWDKESLMEEPSLGFAKVQ